MLNFRMLRPGEQVYMITDDVSGSSVIPCNVLEVNDKEVQAATINGVAVIIDSFTCHDYYLSEVDASHALRENNTPRSCWM